MSRDYDAEINLHVVWHTKLSTPTLTPRVAEAVYADLRSRVLRTSGVILHAVGGIETHVHLAISIPPTLTISPFVGQLKGGSSHAVNQDFPALPEQFAWQGGYGVVSFGTRDLDWVVGYIRRQKEHHAKGTGIDRLERITEMEDEPVLQHH
jgi:REP element-mobilizing transposase RayT